MRRRYLVRWVDARTWRAATTIVKADRPDLYEIQCRVAEQRFGSSAVRYVARVELTDVFRDRRRRHWFHARRPPAAPEEKCRPSRATTPTSSLN